MMRCSLLCHTFNGQKQSRKGVAFKGVMERFCGQGNPLWGKVTCPCLMGTGGQPPGTRFPVEGRMEQDCRFGEHGSLKGLLERQR